MKQLRHITMVSAALLLALTVSAQSRAYAKFNGSGEIIGLFNLTDSGTECRQRQLISGSIRNVWIKTRDTDIGFSFTFDGANSYRIFSFRLKTDAIPRADIESLLRRRFRISVAACKNGGQWTAEEITRL